MNIFNAAKVTASVWDLRTFHLYVLSLATLHCYCWQMPPKSPETNLSDAHLIINFLAPFRQVTDIRDSYYILVYISATTGMVTFRVQQ